MRSLFGKKEKAETPVTAAVQLAALEDWLKQARAPAHARLAQDLSATKGRIDQLAALIREKVQGLNSATLMNPDIPERAKDFMQGNREEYSRRVLHHLDAVTIPGKAEELPGFLEQHHQETGEFAHGINRPFQILQEFFSRETKDIAALLADIEYAIQGLPSMRSQAKMDEYNTLCTQIQELAAKHTQSQGLAQQIQDLKQQSSEAERNIALLQTEQARLLNDAARKAASQKLDEARLRVKTHEQQIRELFAQFEPGLRMFRRMATRNLKLADSYLRDPVAALVQDLRFDFIEVLADIQRLLSFDRIPLGEKRERVLNAMGKITKESLGTWMREYGQLTKAEKEAQFAVENCEASRTLQKIQRLQEEHKRTLQIIEQRLAYAQKDRERIGLEKLKTALEERLKDITGAEVTITF